MIKKRKRSISLLKEAEDDTREEVEVKEEVEVMEEAEVEVTEEAEEEATEEAEEEATEETTSISISTNKNLENTIVIILIGKRKV